MAGISLKAGAALLFFMALLHSASLGHAQSPGERIWTTPPFGAFYSLQLGGTNFPPLPFLPFDPIDVPTYVLDPVQHTYIYDDSEIDYEELNSLQTLNTSPPDPPGEGGGSNGGAGHSIAYDYGTNDLWLEIFPATTNFTVPLLLHGVKSDYYYQLDQTTNLLTPIIWTNTQLIQNTTGTNQLDFGEVSILDSNAKFFRAAEGYPLVRILWQQDAIEAESATNANTRTLGIFNIEINDSPLATNFTIHYVVTGYKISDSAENGIDYTNLPGTINFPEGLSQIQLFVDPTNESLIEFSEFVTVTLVRTNNYLVDPQHASATLLISDSFMPDVFTVVAKDLNFAGGIGYHPVSNSLIASLRLIPPNDHRFVQIYTNIVFTNSTLITNTVITNWSGVTNLTDEEIKLAIVQETTNGYIKGEMFFGPGDNGLVGKVSADGSSSNLTWAILSTNQSSLETILRGGLHVDETGVFSNSLVVVSGDGRTNGGGVWTIAATTNAEQLANITNSHLHHLEGVTTISNTPQVWGPWAGKILTGSEVLTPPLVYSIAPNGTVESYDMGIEPEDFDVVKPNYDLYCVHEGSAIQQVPHRIVKLPRSLLTNYWGGLVITQEGAQSSPRDPRLFIVQWNSTTSRFVTRCIRFPFFLENVTFAPLDLPSLPNEN